MVMLPGQRALFTLSKHVLMSIFKFSSPACLITKDRKQLVFLDLTCGKFIFLEIADTIVSAKKVTAAHPISSFTSH